MSDIGYLNIHNFDFFLAFKQKISVTNKCNWPRKVDLKLRIVRFCSVRIVRYPFHSLILAVLSWINFVTWRQTFKIKCKQCQNWNYILVYSKKKLITQILKKRRKFWICLHNNKLFWYHFLCVLHKQHFFREIVRL